MARYIIALVLIIVIGLIKADCVYADVRLVSPIDNVAGTSNRAIPFKWEKVDDTREYTYMLEIGPSVFGEAGMWNALIGIGDIKQTEYTYTIPNEWGDEISWWVKYTIDEEDSKKTYSSTISSFTISNVSSSGVAMQEPVVVKPVVKDIPRNAIKLEEETPESIAWEVDTQSSVLGVSDTTICKFKYLTNKRTSSVVECNIPVPNMTDLYMYQDVDEWRIYAKGSFAYRLLGQIDIYQCKRNWNPLSWLRCEEEYLRTEYLDIYPGVSVTVSNSNGDIQIQEYSNQGKAFNLTSQKFPNTNGLKLHFSYNILETKYNLKYNQGYDFDITSVKGSSKTTKPLSFPFAKIIGVTQWHGNTAFQKPHTGIDFGSAKEEVLAVSDGQVVANGWDSLNGECMSGGNYIVIKQSNGMYTAYFHLQESYVKYGQKISKGMVIGISGNTGSWNCQALKYHLHFETRTNRNQSSHVNPVDYVDTDWSKVLTLNAKALPERLSGENPHPNY